MKIKESIELYLSYCKTKGLSRHTISLYKTRLRELCDYLSKNNMDVCTTDVSVLNKQIIKKYFLQLYGKFSTSSISTIRAALSAYFEWLVEYAEVFEFNIIKSTKLNLPRSHKLQSVTRYDDFVKLSRYFENVNNCFRNYQYYRDKFIIQVLYSCGIRRAELCKLKMSSYNQTEKYFTIICKGNKERKIHLTSDDIVETLDKVMFFNPYSDDYVVAFSKKVPCSTPSISGVITRICNVVGIESHLTPHSFRRGCATFLIENGVDVSRVKEVLGHSNISTTMRYVYLSDKSVVDTMTKYNPIEMMKKGDMNETKIAK